MPTAVYNCTTAIGRNYRAVWHDVETWNTWSRRLNKLLRHNVSFPLNRQGFAFAEDIVYALQQERHREFPHPDVADLIFIVSTQQRLRFQATSLAGTGGYRDFMIRTVQGQSGAIARQIDLDAAHTRITERSQVEVLTHHTSASRLYEISGALDSPGLIPGGPQGVRNRETRNTTHCSMSNATAAGVLPDKFRRRGTDCAIHLDVDLLLQDGIRLYRSAAGVILVPDIMGAQYIPRAAMSTRPQFVLYSKPRQAQLDAATGPNLSCLDCGTVHRRGCWWCLACWEALTWAGIADRQTYVIDHAERTRELRVCYAVSMPEFDAIVRAPGHAVNTLPARRLPRPADEADTVFLPPWHYGDRRKAPAPAHVAMPALSVAATARSGNAPSGTTLDPSCVHLSARKIRDLIKSARRVGYFSSHTDRWRRDLAYRHACNSHNPVTPEWLQFPSGQWARLDGVEELPPSSATSASSRG